ncbi:hypothetical protein F4V43_07555 [Paenibacillus spiritus]|uniref:Uncharacterized protein n=1 Tax=Paenibacillus spiritus TaxID=2496557 RepID=A0A5J5GBP6_9BACL|nr:MULTISPECIES: hypothetical protein [Paenibacillus]KAA9005323.1 hypothetical protein F4V43_07555 [Paenibacillus spiritus]
MKILKWCLLLLLALTIMAFSGCSKKTDINQKEVLKLQGSSAHWNAEYMIKESNSESKYLLQCYITPLNQDEQIYSISYDIESPGSVSQLSGTLFSNKNSSIFPTNTISPSISTDSLPPKGEDIVITIKWNEQNEEKIKLNP